MTSALEGQGLLRPEHDRYLLRRFLRARAHDVVKALAMFKAHLQWRKDFGADELDSFHFHERDAFISLYPQGYHMTDKLGRPIYIQHLGDINLKRIYELTSEDRMLKFHVQEYERCVQVIMPACSKVAGRHIDQTFAILDVKGVGLSHLSGSVRKMLQKITSIDQNNYPEMLGKTCIINAPGAFKMLWSAIQGMIDPKTRQKIEICPRDYTPTLLKYVDASSLPEYLGGTSKATLVDDAGPWHDPKIIAAVQAERQRQLSGLPREDSDAASSQPVTSPFAAASHLEPPPSPVAAHDNAVHSTFDAPPALQQDSALETDMDDAQSEYAEALSRHGSIASMYSTADEEGLGDSPRQEARRHEAAAASTAEVQLQGLGDAELGRRSSKARGSIAPGGQPGLIPIIARVRALEDHLPGLQERLRPSSARHSGMQHQGTLLQRVEVLEEAVDLLLRAQEVDLQTRRHAEQQKESSVGCCAGCCIM